MFDYIKINYKFELNGDWHCIYEYHFVIVLQFRCNHKIIRNLHTKTEHNLQTQNYP